MNTDVIDRDYASWSTAIAHTSPQSPARVPPVPVQASCEGVEARYHSPFSLAFEQSERELGLRIGFPALVYDAPDDELTTEQVLSIAARPPAAPYRCLYCDAPTDMNTPDPGYCVACCDDMVDMRNPARLYINPNIARTV